MWKKNWREKIWADITQEWDIIIVGGGITGAGILREAARLGLKALLVEQRDFSWGTSSRSSKLVHGGLRYLKEGKIGLTLDSVREREQLLKLAPGLVEPLDFLLATYDGDNPGRFIYRAGLTIYDLLALRWSHRYYSSQDFRLMAGQLSAEGLEGGYRYGDAQTDDSRLVLRVIGEGLNAGGTALNYTKATLLLRDEEGKACGLTLKEMESGQEADVLAPIIINATGAWSDNLRGQMGKESKIRPLRGSHLIFPSWRIPVAQAVSFLHPLDNRPVFLFPWKGVTLVGTTDVDFDNSLDNEPAITAAEVAYLMAAVEARYPLLNVKLDDIIATFAGVRPVIGSGKANPSEESRDHVIWQDNGMITVTGGKLTTFRMVALEVLDKARKINPNLPKMEKEHPPLKPHDIDLGDTTGIDEEIQRRLIGFYGQEASLLIREAEPDELQFIPGTEILWAELRWAARAEGVVHLDDLLLRRVRLGLLLENGGQAHLPQIRKICQEELGWSNSRWNKEKEAYLNLWQCCYSLPNRSTIPDWSNMLAEAEEKLSEAPQDTPQRQVSILLLSAILTGIGVIIIYLFSQRKWRTEQNL